MTLKDFVTEGNVFFILSFLNQTVNEYKLNQFFKLSLILLFFEKYLVCKYSVVNCNILDDFFNKKKINE